MYACLISVIFSTAVLGIVRMAGPTALNKSSIIFTSASDIKTENGWWLEGSQ
jgi:hypothetical protein